MLLLSHGSIAPAPRCAHVGALNVSAAACVLNTSRWTNTEPLPEGLRAAEYVRLMLPELYWLATPRASRSIVQRPPNIVSSSGMPGARSAGSPAYSRVTRGGVGAGVGTGG